MTRGGWRGCALTLLLSLAVAGCGSDDDGGGSFPSVSCKPHQLTLSGDVEGTAVAIDIPWTGLAWSQLGDPKSLDVHYDGGTVHVEWASLVGKGDSTAATGTIQMPAGAPRAGEVLCGGAGSLVADHGDGYGFHLTSLSLGPSCPGAPIAGEITGCAGDD